MSVSGTVAEKQLFITTVILPEVIYGSLYTFDNLENMVWRKYNTSISYSILIIGIKTALLPYKQQFK